MSSRLGHQVSPMRTASINFSVQSGVFSLGIGHPLRIIAPRIVALSCTKSEAYSRLIIFNQINFKFKIN